MTAIWHSDSGLFLIPVQLKHTFWKLFCHEVYFFHGPVGPPWCSAQFCFTVYALWSAIMYYCVFFHWSAFRSSRLANSLDISIWLPQIIKQLQRSEIASEILLLCNIFLQRCIASFYVTLLLSIFYLHFRCKLKQRELKCILVLNAEISYISWFTFVNYLYVACFMLNIGAASWVVDRCLNMSVVWSRIINKSDLPREWSSSRRTWMWRQKLSLQVALVVFDS